jgi:uncharacterized protein (TIGR03663 family)
MTRVFAGALVGLAVILGLSLRFARLDLRPMHHDEANQAVKFGALVERGEYRYDPGDHHGPALYYLSLPAAALRGQTTLASLDERTLRGVTAVFGAATILLLLLATPGIGRTAVAAGAWLLALSPAMIFYSRMFIQEPLFACFTLAFVIATGRAATEGRLRWYVGAGLTGGLAIATKETSVIVVPGAIAACAFASWTLRSEPSWRPPRRVRWKGAALASAATAAAIAILFYSSFLTDPAGVLGPVRAAATYLDRGLYADSHAQPWHYYFSLLAYSSSGGLRWSEGLVLVLALAGAATSWRRPDPVRPHRTFWARYLTAAVVIIALVFSGVPYKTPWNVLPFYVLAIALAGVGFSALVHVTASRAVRIAMTAGFVLALAHLGWQAWRASVTYASDPRNPYVYAQTVPDAARMAARIRAVAAVHPDAGNMQVTVIAPPHEQWPLPWYLRTMPHVGYWTELPDALALNAPVIVASLDHADAMDAALGDRYVSEFYGLRPNVLLSLRIERGAWDRFLAAEAAAGGR